ncbi:MAG: hypothetical protein PVS3B3_04500 [Ktedonobacteraceae bacterium]
MSRSTTHTFTCPCGTTFTGVTYEYVNAAQDPQLRYVILSGSLNVSTCPNCGRRAAISTPFIYSDPEHNLLAYVHPRSDAPEEARMLVLEQLRSVYINLTDEQQEYVEGRSEQRTRAAVQAEKLPPLQVIFGMEQLNEVINAVLGPDERMGRLALSTQSRNEAERGQFLDITRKLASEMACGVEVEDFPDEYTVWVFGSRRQIGALMRELTPRG